MVFPPPPCPPEIVQGDEPLDVSVPLPDTLVIWPRRQAPEEGILIIAMSPGLRRVESFTCKELALRLGRLAIVVAGALPKLLLPEIVVNE